MKTYIVKNQEEGGFFLKNILLNTVEEKDYANIALPGGRSIIPFLHELKGLNEDVLSKLHFYLTDERIQGVKNKDTLYKEAFDELLESARIRIEQIHFPESLEKMKEELVKSFDIIILGVGEDGHIASLFPEDDALETQEKVVEINNSPKPPSNRITLTFNAMNKDATIVLLFFGESKKEALKRFKNMDDYRKLPAAYFYEYDDVQIVTDQNSG